jgi:hypothetical protein
VVPAEDLADPDMCGHLWPGADPGAPGAPGAFGAVDAFGDGLAAVEEDAAEDVPDRAGVEEVEALAMLSPSARVAPSTAPPTAVPARGLLILTRFSLLVCSPGPRRPGAGRGDPLPQLAKPTWRGPERSFSVRAEPPWRSTRRRF